MEYVGEVLDFTEFQNRAKSYSANQHFYFMALNSDEIVDATSKGNISRFINHSCDPTAETQKVRLRVIYTIDCVLLEPPVSTSGFGSTTYTYKKNTSICWSRVLTTSSLRTEIINRYNPMYS